MSNPATLDEIKVELTELRKKINKDININMFPSPQKHPYAFLIFILLVYIVLNMLSDLSTTFVKKYVTKKGINYTEELFIVAILCAVIYWLYSHYKFTLSDLEV